MLTSASREANPDTYGLELYGFGDFTYTRLLEDHWREQPWDTFAVGRLNLYAAAELGDGWRSLFEVRFSYLPNGTLGDPNPDGTVPRFDTLVVDYTDLDRYTRWGGIVLERAWLEHTFGPWLTLRAGNWLTPYGIWNVDHGSPVIVGVRRPFIVAEQLLPQYQTGLQAHGFHNLDWVRLGYDLTLSNGRGPIDTYQDLDRNKAIGGRGFVQADTTQGLFTLGISFYSGTYTDRLDQLFLDPNGFFRIDSPITQQFDELSFALDMKWELWGFLFQAEAVTNDVAYTDGARPRYWEPGGLLGFIPDHRRLGAYALGGYRFEWGGIMPFAGLEYYDPGFGPMGDIAAFWGGINLRPTARVTLKAQYTYSWLVGQPTPATLNYNALGFQAAWSF